MGINLGSLLAPLITGYLQTRVSFHAGFLAAAIGMFCGLVVYAIKNTNFLISGLVNGFGTLRPAKPKFFLRLIA